MTSEPLYETLCQGILKAVRCKFRWFVRNEPGCVPYLAAKLCEIAEGALDAVEKERNEEDRFINGKA